MDKIDEFDKWWWRRYVEPRRDARAKKSSIFLSLNDFWWCSSFAKMAFKAFSECNIKWLTRERIDHIVNIIVQLIDLVIITDPRWSDLGKNSGSFDAIFNQRTSTAQKFLKNA